MNKNNTILTVAAILFSACSEPIIYDTYSLVMPEMNDAVSIETDTLSAAAWPVLLGKPHWHIEWIDSKGNPVQKEITESHDGKLNDIDILGDLPSAIIAYPYWPDKKIMRGSVRPAGAIFPHDASGNKIHLTWQGGIEANFYKELNYENNEKRLAYKFDWMRFRNLFVEGALHSEIIEDPWLADWHQIAEKTAASGFDKRRIVPSKLVLQSVVIPQHGPWLLASPFAKIQNWQKDAPVNIGVKDNSTTVDNYFCPTGVLHINNKVYTWAAF
ncbi:hypothetical protein FACS1894102_1440 [Spirochaetia bacterium]|nr:hypothetical protein FACS1894102_1440 [Spirochaetia bacterium]